MEAVSGAVTCGEYTLASKVPVPAAAPLPARGAGGDGGE